jgi:hypothetical protein
MHPQPDWHGARVRGELPPRAHAAYLCGLFIVTGCVMLRARARAHRIWQQPPVTVYRLVTEGTIEDKIVALHATKRPLADDVLAGLERVTAPDLDELRRLLEG